MTEEFDRELTPVEAAIYEVYLRLADGDGAWVPLRNLRPHVPFHHKDVTEALLFMDRNGDAHLAPDSNTKMLTNEDHEAAVKHGMLGEKLHLVAFASPDDFNWG